VQAIETQSPFDVLFLDVWTPGDFPAQWGALKVLTCLEGMSLFAEAVSIDKADSTTISRAASVSFFIPDGLPKLVVFDVRSEFAGAMTKMCTNLGIPFHTVAKENHEGDLKCYSSTDTSTKSKRSTKPAVNHSINGPGEAYLPSMDGTPPQSVAQT
jgi:hypothetical protein